MGLEIINKLKKQKGFTTEKLSSESGIPIGTLNKILSGTTKDPKLETLRALARVLGCTLDDFDDSQIEKETLVLSSNETKLLESYNKLNDLGKNEAAKRVSELTEIPKYISNNEISATVENPSKILESMYSTIAAHDDDLTDEGKIEMDRRILEKINKLHNGK